MDKRVLFVVCSCFIVFKAQTVSASCPFKMIPSSVVVEYGDSFTVDCVSTTDQNDGMGWESTKQGTGLKEVNNILLKIDQVDSWEIRASCYMNFENGTQCVEKLPITVYKKPDTVFIQSPNPSQPMEEDKEYELQCTVVNIAPVKNVQVTWYKDDKIIAAERLSANPEQKPLSQSSRYTLRAQRSDNGGKLKCDAKFDFGSAEPNLQPHASQLTDLRVVYRPFFEKSAETVEVPANRKITLNCTAQGNPTPQYHWQVPQPTQQKIGSEPVLDLTGPFPGTYNCTASNSQGSRVKQFVVTDAPRDFTVLAAVVGVVAALGVLLLISGPFIVTKDGTFSCSNSGYSKGQPSQPI